MKQSDKTTSTRVKTGKEISSKTLQQIRKIVDATDGRAGAPIRVLQQVQGLVGYLPPEVLRAVSEEMGIPLSKVYGITSFYSFFSLVPKGKYVLQVCNGTSCYVKGAERILATLKKDYGLESGGITSDEKFSLEQVRCLGCCGLSPVMAIKENVYRKVKPSQIKDILTSYK
ncbi:MAG: NAD(P)H-dependent oxidoreductase subunit E [Dehalococcoidia bacterium]|nr:NAD(P)H-dependent oxidoreductase subunit E [Dehalococcoidia bacterium]